MILRAMPMQRLRYCYQSAGRAVPAGRGGGRSSRPAQLPPGDPGLVHLGAPDGSFPAARRRRHRQHHAPGGEATSPFRLTAQHDPGEGASTSVVGDCWWHWPLIWRMLVLFAARLVATGGPLTHSCAGVLFALLQKPTRPKLTCSACRVAGSRRRRLADLMHAVDGLHR